MTKKYLLALLIITFLFLPKPGRGQELTPSVQALNGLDGSKDIQLEIIEFLETKYQPLLPYVYFEKNSDAIPKRYNLLTEEESADFEEKELYGMGTIDVYHNILNLIGRRMTKSDPSIKLIITGCTDGMETGGVALAERRANSVKTYLMKIWKIPESRLIVKGELMPKRSTKSIGSDEESNEENRRVEFSSTETRLLDPVHLEKIIKQPNPPVVRFNISVVPDGQQQRWGLEVFQKDNMLFEPRSTQMPKFKDWQIMGENSKIPALNEPVKYRLNVWNKDNHVFSTDDKSFSVEQITLLKKKERKMNDTIWDNYSLILYDFNESNVTPTHKRLLEFVKKKIAKESIVEIAGYADRLGTSDYNSKLSQNRAESVKKILGKKNIKATGFGEASLYNTDIPEGRAYSRTVDIKIITPIKY